MRIEFVGGPHDGLTFDLAQPPEGLPAETTTRFAAPASGRDHVYRVQWQQGRAMHMGAAKPEARHGREDRDRPNA